MAKIAIGATINFFALSTIFTITLSSTTPLLYAVLKGITLALIATSITLIIDLLTGGLATIMLVPIYGFTLLAALVLSLVHPSFISKSDGTLSGFYVVSFSFWPIFFIGMIIALVLGLSLNYLASRFSSSISDMIQNLDISQFTSQQKNINSV
jgi:hypothetical protein